VSVERDETTTEQAKAEALPLPGAVLRVLRLHQWAKNLLVVLPVVGAHRLGDAQALRAMGAAFLSFGLVASAVYVVNDMIDVEADRRHPRKRLRPFASGALPLRAGVLLAPVLLLAGGAIALGLPPAFRLLLAGYFALTLVYSFVLKRQPIVDVLVLAGLYTSRMFAGGFATGIPISAWLAMFSMFLFTSLAFVKRASELAGVEGVPPGRGYRGSDREAVSAMGVGAGYVSVLVLALYVSSHEVRQLYSRPQWLWALCPLVLYWVSRLWLRAHRGEVHDDPLVSALKDKVTYLVAAAAAAVVYASV
jgi:4-hydroxybenzoate polyprenyltransferase